jgi:hypothetical protein
MPTIHRTNTGILLTSKLWWHMSALSLQKKKKKKATPFRIGISLVQGGDLICINPGNTEVRKISIKRRRVSIQYDTGQ